MTDEADLIAKQRKINESRSFAKEYRNYARTMPNDAFATRWNMIAEAFEFQADAIEREIKP